MKRIQSQQQEVVTVKFLPSCATAQAVSLAYKPATLMGGTVTAVADGLPRNEVVHTALPGKMCLIIAAIIRLIWGGKLSGSLRNTVRLIYEEVDTFPPRNAA